MAKVILHKAEFERLKNAALFPVVGSSYIDSVHVLVHPHEIKMIENTELVPLRNPDKISKWKDELQLSNGMIVSSLRDLSHALAVISDDNFDEHVSGRKNDIAQWVEHAYDDPVLGAKIRRCTGRDEVKRAVDVYAKFV